MCFFILIGIVVVVLLDCKNTKHQLEISRLKDKLSDSYIEIARLRSKVDGLKVVRNTKVKD